MSDHRYPLYVLAGNIEAALEVADELCTLEPNETEANHIADIRHIAAVIHCARLATALLTTELCKVADKEEGKE